MSIIASLFGREILDSRGNPTVEVEVSLESGQSAAPPCLPGHPPAAAKLWKCVTATKNVTAARA